MEMLKSVPNARRNFLNPSFLNIFEIVRNHGSNLTLRTEVRI
jgi:hypothetical protein